MWRICLLYKCVCMLFVACCFSWLIWGWLRNDNSSASRVPCQYKIIHCCCWGGLWGAQQQPIYTCQASKHKQNKQTNRPNTPRRGTIYFIIYTRPTTTAAQAAGNGAQNHLYAPTKQRIFTRADLTTAEAAAATQLQTHTHPRLARRLCYFNTLLIGS